MYSSSDFSSPYPPHPLTRSDRWSDACGDAVGEAGAAAITGLTRVIQLPFVAAAFILGEVADTFLRASDNVGDAVGREAGRFTGRIVGALAATVFSVIEAGASLLYNAAHDAFVGAIHCARMAFPS